MKSKLLLIAALTLCAFSAQAQSLWGKTKVGMTVEQVKAAYPGAYDPPGDDKLGSGALELLVVEGVQLADTKFKARFFFADGKLSNVLLGLDQEFANVGSGWAVYDTIKNALSSKYGNPTDVENKSDSFTKKMSADWVSGPLSVSVLYMAIGAEDKKPVLNIAYKTISKTVDNL
jgi:hypothetical protein